MKKIILLLISIVLTTICKAQEIDVNGAAIKKTKGMTELRGGQVDTFVKKTLKKNIYLMRGSSPSENAFKINNILISFTYHPRIVPDTFLSIKKKNYETLSDPATTTSIKTVNNKNFLIVHRKSPSDNYYIFFGVNKFRHNYITGSLHFNPEDSVEAKKVLKDLLKSVKFKK